MKKILFIFAIAGLIFAGCGNKKKKDTIGYHTHEDGTVHRDDAHNHDNNSKPAQESFEVKTDNDAEHKHPEGDNDPNGHKHEYGDGNGDSEGHNHDKDEHGHEHGDTAGHDHDHEHGDHK